MFRVSKDFVMANALRILKRCHINIMRRFLILLLLTPSYTTSLPRSLLNRPQTGERHDCRIDSPKKDQNGDVCAIIKVVTSQTGLIWEPDGLGIVWRTKGRRILAQYLLVQNVLQLSMRNWEYYAITFYPLPIEKQTVYEMVLTTGKVVTTVEKTIEVMVGNYSEPADALIYLNDNFEAPEPCRRSSKPDTYTYRVENPLFYSQAGKVELSADKKEKLKITLKPNHGFVKIFLHPRMELR